jgi:hypothetical protein
MSHSINTLQKEYCKHAKAHGLASDKGDFKKANRSHDKLVALVPKFRELGAEGEAALLSLTREQNDAIACWSAPHSLPFAESNALAVLGVLSQKAGIMSFNAKMVIQQWQKGQLVLP